MDKSLKTINSSLPFRCLSFVVFHLTLLLVVIFDTIVYTVSIEGRKNLRVDKAFLVSNHTLYLDPALIAHVVFPRRTYYSALEETFKRPFIGTYIRLLGAFPLPEKNPLPRVMRSLRKALTTRGLVHFFPEGELFHRTRYVAYLDCIPDDVLVL